MFYKDQPVLGSRPACLDAKLSLGCGTTLTKAGGRDGGGELEGRKVDGLVQPARTAGQERYGFWLDTTTGAKWVYRFYEPKEGET